MMILQTRDEELVVEENICVAVRVNGQWLTDHPLIGCKWLGSVELHHGRVCRYGSPVVGMYMLFDAAVVTSELVSYATYLGMPEKTTRQSLS